MPDGLPWLVQASGIPQPRSLRRPGYGGSVSAAVPRGHLHTPLRFAGPVGPSQPSTSRTQGCLPLTSTLAVAVGPSPSICFAAPAVPQQYVTPFVGPGLSGMGQHTVSSPVVAGAHAAAALMPPPPGGAHAAQQLQQALLPEEQDLQAARIAHAQASSAALPPAQLAQLAALAQLGMAQQAAASAQQAASAQLRGHRAGSEAAQASQGAGSVLSMRSLVGNSAIQGHPLPLPAYMHQITSAALAAALHAVGQPGAGSSLAAGPGGAAGLMDGQAAAAAADGGSPEPQLVGSRAMTPLHAGGAAQLPPAQQRVQQPASSRVAAPTRPPAQQWESQQQQAAGELGLTAHLQQAASIVEGCHSPAVEAFVTLADALQQDPLPPAEPQAAVIQDATLADLTAASHQAPFVRGRGRPRSTDNAHSTEGNVVHATDMEAGARYCRLALF